LVNNKQDQTLPKKKEKKKLKNKIKSNYHMITTMTAPNTPHNKKYIPKRLLPDLTMSNMTGIL